MKQLPYLKPNLKVYKLLLRSFWDIMNLYFRFQLLILLGVAIYLSTVKLKL